VSGEMGSRDGDGRGCTVCMVCVAPVVRRSLGRFVGGWVGVGGDGVARWGWGVTCCLTRVAGVVDEKPPSLAQNGAFWILPGELVDVSGPKTVRFGSVNGRYQKCNGRDFIPVSFHPGSKFSKKKPKHFKILEGRPKELLYIYPYFFHIFDYVVIDSGYSEASSYVKDSIREMLEDLL
jgi:hypothetical protein